MFCGPTRLVWFGIGSVATWAWIRHHEDRRRLHDHQGWCPARADYRPQTQTQTQNTPREWNPMTTGQGQAWAAHHQGQGTNGAAPAPAPAPGTPPQSPADQDYERLRQIGRNAEETISGMSEATIDTMMGALQRLKDRLEERRGQQQFQENEARQQTSSMPAPLPEESSRSRHWI